MKKVYKLEDLDCAHCASKMEVAIGKLEGVSKCTVGFLTQKLTMETEFDNQEALMQKVKKICKKIEPDCIIHI